jgi:hypothetical protein
MTIREDRFGNAVQASRPELSQVLAVGAGSVASAPFAVNLDRPQRQTDGTVQSSITQLNHTRHVRIVCTVPAWVSFGVAPIAARLAPTSMFMPAGLPEYFWVAVGEQIAVTQDATAGSCYITELTN